MNEKDSYLKKIALKAFAPVLFLMVVFFDTAAFAGIGGCVNLPFVGPICVSQCIAGASILGSMGDILCNVINGTSLIPSLISALAYLFGLILAVLAILKVKEHVENPQQTPAIEPIKRFLAGGMFFAFPTVTQALLTTFAGENPAGFDNNPLGISSGAPTGGGLDSVFFFFVMDIFEPALDLIGVFAYIAALVLTMIGIGRLIKSSQEGAKGPAGVGTIMTFVAAGVLFALESIFAAINGSLFGTLFGTSYVYTHGLISTTGNFAVDNNIQAVISATIGFMVIVGFIAFVRGIFILRDVAEGGQQASLMAAVTHIVGGAMAVNIGGVVNAVQNTFGLNYVTFI